MVDNTYPLAKVKYTLNTQHFEEVALKIKEHGKNMKSDDLENVYGLYKQATVGDINIGIQFIKIRKAFFLQIN